VSLASNLIKWTPKILEASADDVARFGPQAARVRALLNFIPTMSDDAAKISSNSWYSAQRLETDPMWGAWRQAEDAVGNAARVSADDRARYAAEGAAQTAGRYPAMYPAEVAGRAEMISDLIEPEVYRKLTNPMASARALDRLAGRAPESFVPTARDMGDRGLVSAPADIVTALRISKLPPSVQPLVMGLVDSGMTIEDALSAARALS
jgi:hypothetical protein